MRIRASVRVWVVALLLCFAVACAKSGGGGGSSTPSVMASSTPPAVTVTNIALTQPATATVLNSASSLTLSGACTNSALITLSGDVLSSDVTDPASQLTQVCTNSVFRFDIAKSADGIYGLTVAQSGQGNNSSASVTWTRDTLAPAGLTLTSPASASVKNNASTLVVAGACETGAQVDLSGDSAQSQSCAAAAYSFSVTKNTDAVYSLAVRQGDAAGNNSAAINITWTRDTQAPAAPSITAPSSSPVVSSADDLAIQGTCENAATVSLGGDETQSTVCASSVFAFTVSRVVDGNYHFTVVQTDAAGNTSAPASVDWTRNSAVPPAPVVTLPGATPYYSKNSSETFSGTCQNGATLTLAGDVVATDVLDPANSLTRSCSGGAFSYTVMKAVDGSYGLTLKQTVLGMDSAPASMQWILDTAAPAAPTLTLPASSPLYSNASSLTLSGSCESSATVNLSNASTQSALCSGGAFSFVHNQSTDGTYSYQISQTDRAGNNSSSVSQQWVRDTSAPSAPTLTSPVSSPVISGASNLTIAGACENFASVALTGDSTQSQACSGGGYSFTVNKSTDGSYSFSVKQTDRAGNASATASVQWTRDATAPAAPTITAPGASPYTSSASSITLSGACETGATVLLSGDSTDSMVCTANAYSFVVNKNTDATYNFALKQTDTASNESASASFQWVRNTAIPPTPTITTPASSPLRNNSSSLTISGGCTDGSTVTLAGDVIAGDVTTPAGALTQTCSGSAYSFVIAKNTDNTFNFTVKQTVLGIDSATAAQQWTRDTSAPATPTVTSPATSPYYSSGSSLVLSGVCETGASVDLTGDSMQSTVCAGSAYSFTISKSADGSYSFNIRQTDLSGNASGIKTQQWVRDTLAPAAPTQSAPASNPFTSSDTSLVISGACESAATVSIAGAMTSSSTCSSGSYSFSTSQSVDGTYDYAITQTDRAGNASSQLSFRWVRDTTVPPTPTVTTPAASPAYSSSPSLAIAGGCETSNIVDLTGDDTQNFTCATSAYNFNVSKITDGFYSFNVMQTNPTSGLTSGPVLIEWYKDSIAPSAPVITAPALSPYTSSGNLSIQGTCETGATVNLSGDSTLSTVCADSSFSFLVNKSVDATYNFSVSQTDLALNASSSVSQQWIRNSTVPPAPGVSTPASNPYKSNGSSLTISGSCTSGLVVTLGGDVLASDVTAPAGSLTQICASSAYSFSLSKTVDSTYNFALKQTQDAMDSANASVQWVRDTTPPDTSLTAQPTDPNLSQSASFSFTSPDGTATFECSLDGAAYSACTSPQALTALANGAHSFAVKAKDPTGNVDASPASYSWTQAAYNTVALYHFTSGSDLVDSSSYSGAENNALTNSGTTTTASGKFAAGRSFAAASSQYLYKTDNQSQDMTRLTMTVEAFVKHTSLPSSNGDYQVIASKMGASGQYGWELGIKRTSAKYYMYFKGSVNGTTVTELRSSQLTIGTGSWHHFAVTWDKGTLKFYYDGAAKGSGTIGTAGSATLFQSNADLRLGRTQTMGGTNLYLDGAMDEFRLSQVVRWTSAFTPTTSAYSAD